MSASQRRRREIPWEPRFAEFFRLAAADWTPPATVQQSSGVSSFTLSAHFKNASGNTFTCKTRCRRKHGEWSVTSEEMTARFVSPPKARAA